MNKFTKLILTSAIFATSGFATTISGDTIMQKGWDIANSDTASIASGKTVTMQGVSKAASDISIKGSASLTNSGTLVMYDASAINSTSTADPAFVNSGTLNLENTTDFSNFNVKVSNANGSKVVIPAPNADITAVTGDKFKLAAPQGDGETFTVEYAAGGKTLSLNGTKLEISGDAANGKYDDKVAITTKTGINFEGDDDNTHIKISNTGSGLSEISMDYVIAHKENKEENKDKTFDIGQAGLSSPDIALTEAKTIHFGLVGSADMDVTGAYKLTLAGDNSNMLGKIATANDLDFSGEATKGNIDCGGVLTLGYQGTQSLEGIINANSLTIPSGATVTFTNKLTTGWNNE